MWALMLNTLFCAHRGSSSMTGPHCLLKAQIILQLLWIITNTTIYTAYTSYEMRNQILHTHMQINNFKWHVV